MTTFNGWKNARLNELIDAFGYTETIAGLVQLFEEYASSFEEGIEKAANERILKALKNAYDVMVEEGI